MRYLLRLTTAALLATFVLWSSNAAAQDASELYKQGTTAFDDGRFIDAADAFRAAYEAKPHWKLFYNIGQSEASAKRHGLALQAFEAYLSQGGDEVPTDRREEVLDEVERLRKMVGKVEVVAPDGAVIIVDNVARGTAPILGKLPVAAGVDHAIWAELDGEKLEEREFQVTGGDVVSIEFSAPTDGGETGSVPDVEIEAEGDGSPMVTAGWVTLGLGAALLIGGGVTGGMALGVDGDLKDKCVGSHCPENREADIDKLDSLALTTNILLGVGAAAAITGTVLLIVGYSGEESDGEESISLAPTIGPHLTGLAVQGRF